MNIDRPRSDRVLYLGMNEDSADAEANALRSHGATVNQLRPHDGANIAVDRVCYDLAGDEGIRAFCKDLARKYALGPEHEDALVVAFQASSPNSRDELAQIAMAWAPAEEGQAIASRVVISGHHGGAFYGPAHDSMFSENSLRALAAALPNAARQIEDIHFSGCNTDGPVQDAESWRASFPNLKTLWGYAGSAPLVPAGHLVEWELATRGRSDYFRQTQLQHHHNAIAWSARGDLAGVGSSLAERLEARDRANGRYEAWFTGRLSGPSDDALADNLAYRRISAAREIPAAEREEARSRADVMQRLRFYESGVRVKFQEAHGATIEAAYADLGLHAPNFANLTRAGALRETHAFLERVAESPAHRTANVDRAVSALHGLATLDATSIPEWWCH